MMLLGILLGIVISAFALVIWLLRVWVKNPDQFKSIMQSLSIGGGFKPPKK